MAEIYYAYQGMLLAVVRNVTNLSGSGYKIKVDDELRTNHERKGQIFSINHDHRQTFPAIHPTIQRSMIKLCQLKLIGR